MEADLNQDAPEAVAQTDVSAAEAPEQLKSEEVTETPPAQDPAEPEKPAEEDSKPEAVESEKSPEKEEVPEKAAEEEKSAEEPAEVEKKPENEVVEQQITEPAEAEQNVEAEKAEDTGNEEPAASEPPADSEKPSEAQAVQAEAPQAVAAQPENSVLPLFYGWFLQPAVEERIKTSAVEFLKTLDTLEAFKKHISDFTGDADKELALEQYFQTKAPLHCTTQFCDYGKAEGAKEYAEQQVVKENHDKTTELSVVGLIATPRTFGARVSLTPEQLLLWPTGADKMGVPAADLPGVEALPVGSRAHVTLGHASGVEAFQTGIDLLEILILQQGEEKSATVEELEMGTLSYLDKGRWYLALKEAVTCNATFSGFSEEPRPAEPAKKEGGEKKKKFKCLIL